MIRLYVTGSKTAVMNVLNMLTSIKLSISLTRFILNEFKIINKVSIFHQLFSHKLTLKEINEDSIILLRLDLLIPLGLY